VRILRFTIILAIIFSFPAITSAQEDSDTWPRRVLITNDDGIDRVQITELARAFAEIAETWVVAPINDRSGTSAHVTGHLQVHRRKIGEGIQAFAVAGYPADCVSLALLGLMPDNPPDLVISGINTGPNLAHAWVVSGTIGAARMAATMGVPAIAVSGLDDKVSGSVGAATKWVVRLAQSDLVRELKAPQYLSVSIPLIPPRQIRGVRFAERWVPQTLKDVLRFEKYRRVDKDKDNHADSTDARSATELWQSEFSTARFLESYRGARALDLGLYREGYVVVVPMIADEHDYEALSRVKSRSSLLPSWPWSGR
jgi:5'-nucleotidase